MEPMTAWELAQRAAVPGSFVDRLVEPGILVAGPDGRFSPGDLHRTRLMRSSEQAGLPVEAIAAALTAGRRAGAGDRDPARGPAGEVARRRRHVLPPPARRGGVGLRASAAAAAGDPTA